jgi:hypothetical protein
MAKEKHPHYHCLWILVLDGLRVDIMCVSFNTTRLILGLDQALSKQNSWPQLWARILFRLILIHILFQKQTQVRVGSVAGL